jgi:hypothetical protein
MRKLILILLAVPLIQGCDQQRQTARFQIIEGTYDEILNNDIAKSSSSSQQHGIFKIDTQTGRTWLYLDATDVTTNGVSVEDGWREIKDLSR